MEKCSREKLVDKIVKEYNLTEEDAHNKAVKILERCPEKLRQNVQEWEIFSADDSGDLGQQRFLKCVGGDDRISGGRD